jgi:beta-phosphoglucomutase-like phosphatase (HAD superfamily)
MLLTQSQVKRFWREWSACIRLHHWDATEAELERKAMLARAGFKSLTEVDHLDGFTAVLKEVAALQDNLSGMLRADDNPRRVLIHSIRSLIDKLGEPYSDKLLRDRFGHTRLDDLTLEQLTQFRYTLSARASARRRPDPESAICHLPSAMPEPECVAGPF